MDYVFILKGIKVVGREEVVTVIGVYDTRELALEVKEILEFSPTRYNYFRIGQYQIKKSVRFSDEKVSER